MNKTSFKSQDDMLYSIIKSFINNFNQMSEVAKIDKFNFRHIKQRMNERNIHIIDLRNTLDSLYKYKLCEFVYLMNLDDSLRPYKINVKSDTSIIVFSRNDEYSWKMNTLLHPKKHNLYDDEVIGNFEQTLTI